MYVCITLRHDDAFQRTLTLFHNSYPKLIRCQLGSTKASAEMPLYIADAGSIGPHALTLVPEEYLVFYASPVHGELWCPVLSKIDRIIMRFELIK